MAAAFGPRPVNLVNNVALTTGAGETTIADFYIEAGTVGLIIDVLHTSGGAGTVTYKIQGYHYTGGVSGWTQSYTDLLTSTALAKDVGSRMVVDPRVAAVANTHASTVLPYRIRIRATAGAANVTWIFLSATQVG